MADMANEGILPLSHVDSGALEGATGMLCGRTADTRNSSVPIVASVAGSSSSTQCPSAPPSDSHQSLGIVSSAKGSRSNSGSQGSIGSDASGSPSRDSNCSPDVVDELQQAPLEVFDIAAGSLRPIKAARRAGDDPSTDTTSACPSTDDVDIVVEHGSPKCDALGSPDEDSGLSLIGMSRSGRALWLSSCGRIVWKEVPLAASADPTPRGQNEATAVDTAAAAAALQHPHLVTVRERRRIGKRLLEGRELCDGGELFDVVANEGGLLVAGRLPMALRLFAQMVSAVAHAHGHGLVAGQLRPEHILLTYERGEAAPPVVKLLGFDPQTWRALKYGNAAPPELHLARERHALDAPELHAVPAEKAGGGATAIDALAAADVWTLGTLLVGLLAGRPPTILRTDTEVEVQLPDEMNEAPPKVLELLHTMLRADPSARPTAAAVKVAVDVMAMPPPSCARSTAEPR